MNIIFAVIAAVAIVGFGIVVRRNITLRSLNQDLFTENQNLNKAVDGLKQTLRTRTSRSDKRISQLQRELRGEQESSLRLAADTTQRQADTDRQLAQAHALLEMVLESEDAGRLHPDAPLSRDKMRGLFCV